jgi:hypothetical protein
MRHFINILYGKTERLYIRTNLPAIADLLGYARSVHDRRGRRVWNMVFGNYAAIPDFLRGLRVFNFVPVPNPER